MAVTNVPALSSESGLKRYLQQIKKFPMLQPEQEYMLAKSFKDHGDRAAAEQLVTSHLRLVAKIAFGYKGYGLAMAEVISEGNIGLMQAVKKFEPEKGFRLATYAMWWIRASIQEYVLRSWSMVKMGTSVSQKRLFFNLRKMKSRLGAYEDNALSPDQLAEISKELGVSIADIQSMNARMIGGDHSLNRKLNADSDDEWINLLSSEEQNQESALADIQEFNARSSSLHDALEKLNDRERDIITSRKLAEPVMTLEDLSQKYGVSRERIRQIESRAMEKLQEFMLPAPDTFEAA